MLAFGRTLIYVVEITEREKAAANNRCADLRAQVDIMRLAMLTVSPTSEYRGRVVPITPPTT